MEITTDAHIWHPCTALNAARIQPTALVASAEGPYLTLENGTKIIDAISSWWCKSLGHNHPALKQALINQAQTLEHVMLAGFTHQPAIKLSAKLAALCPGLNKVFYASDGASAVEIALKLSLHSRLLQQQPQRCKFMALSNGYHGETLLALSVSDIKKFQHPYANITVPTEVIQPIPYVNNTQHPLWHDSTEYWQQVLPLLNQHANDLTAIIVEPIVQGACGIKLYSQDFLAKLRNWTLEHNIHLIADEIMTGIGRTGFPLACQHADVAPDFICLSKGLTSGWLPLSATVISEAIYELFCQAPDPSQGFFHSHTYCGNPLAAQVAVTCLEIMEQENIYQHVRSLETVLATLMQDIATATGCITNLRNIGAIVAADLKPSRHTDDIAKLVAQIAFENGALLRPIGNTIYWLPPLNITQPVLTELKDITQYAISQAYQQPRR